MELKNYTTESIDKQLDLIHELIGLIQNSRPMVDAMKEDDDLCLIVTIQARLFQELKQRQS